MPEVDRQLVAALVVAVGLQRASEWLGVSREVVARYVAGIPIRRGSALQIAIAVAALGSGEGGARGSPPMTTDRAAEGTDPCREEDQR